MRPAITLIYATWLYKNLRNLTLHEFIGPDLREFKRPDITRIYAAWPRILHEFKQP